MKNLKPKVMFLVLALTAVAFIIGSYAAKTDDSDRGRIGRILKAIEQLEAKIDTIEGTLEQDVKPSLKEIEGMINEDITDKLNDIKNTIEQDVKPSLDKLEAKADVPK